MIDDLAKAEIGHFASSVGADFRVLDCSSLEEKCVCNLASVKPLSQKQPCFRSPFSLVFEGPASQPMTQGTYLFRSDTLGELPIFVVPISEKDSTRRYQAIFS
jgi:hypothetical protein